MNRSELKTNAKEKLKGHIWDYLMPLVILFGANILLGFIFPGNKIDLANINYAELGGNNFIDTVISYLNSIYLATYIVYLLELIRNGKSSLITMWECFKKNWLQIFVASILVSLFTILWSLLFIIPGIIAYLSYSMVNYLVVDKGYEAMAAIKKSKEMMKGHKWEYFVLGLSFIGWYLLVPFTFGILLIWLIPYTDITFALYYEELLENDDELKNKDKKMLEN